MDEPPSTVQRSYRQGGPVSHCAYCGAPLDPFYYFCLRCATPYKPLETVVPIAQPRPLGDRERIERMAPHVWTIFNVYLIVIIVASAIANFGFGPGRILAALLLGTVLMAATTCVFAALYWRALAGQLRQIGFNKPWAWIGLAILPLLLGVNFAWHAFIQHVAGDGLMDTDAMFRDSGLGFAGMVVLLCILPAVTEELALRGLVQYWLEVAIKPWKAIAIASALFALLHFSVVSGPYLFFVGLLLGVVRHRTGSLYPCILIHFLHNLVVIAAIWL